MKRRIKTHPEFFSLVWALFIFALCATPGQYIPSVSWLELLSFDKLVHLGVFFVLCTLLFLIAEKRRQGTLQKFFYFFTAVAYGMWLELMQAKVFTNRSADWNDVIANSAGCVLTVVLFNRTKHFLA